jgi:nicotinamidase-related amidase
MVGYDGWSAPTKPYEDEAIREGTPMETRNHGPNHPQPQPIALDAASTAVAVLDLTAKCDDPKQVCSLIIPGVGAMLDRARAANVPIIMTGTILEKGKPEGKAAAGLGRRETEPFLFPDSFDKFYDDEFSAFFRSRPVKSVVMVGSSTHICIMYTATAAARQHAYEVIIPVDGVNTANQYEHDYALHQLSVLPAGTNKRIRFTTLESLTFA